MKMPSKGTTVYIEDGGAPLFVGMDGISNDVLLKYEGHEDRIQFMDLDEFKERRVYPEQLPNPVNLEDIIRE